MLAECLSEQGEWTQVMPGARACLFSLREKTFPLPLRLESLHFEVLFCLAGGITLTRRDGTVLRLGTRQVLLLTDISDLSDARVETGLKGVLVAVDARGARESLKTICSLLGGLNLNTDQVRRWMVSRGGCAVEGPSPWSQAAFADLDRLPRSERARWCVWKSVELLYLLCTEVSESNGSLSGSGCPVSHSLLEVKAYIQTHLSDKLTIAFLCKQFSLSPTFLKEGFRRTYGMPIHSFLVQQRLRRAQELICTTRMPIQQIAQAVGYEGMSQFNAAFKREYGMTPGQYRKMSETATLRLF